MAVLLLSAVAALVLAGARQAAASFGDRDPNFVSCVNHYGAAFKGPLPTHLRLLGWSPDAETRYHCMHLVTKWRKQNNLPMLQYYGKWPFTRVYGIQEPASLVASLGNGYFVLRGLFLYRRKVPQR